MTQDEMRALNVGDMVRHVHGGDVYVVNCNYFSHVLATHTQHISNPREWVLVSPHNRRSTDQQPEMRRAG